MKTLKNMNTASYKRTYSLPFEKETLLYRAQKLSERIKVNELTMEDVVTQVAAYRKKRNAKGSSNSRLN